MENYFLEILKSGFSLAFFFLLWGFKLEFMKLLWRFREFSDFWVGSWCPGDWKSDVKCSFWACSGLNGLFLIFALVIMMLLMGSEKGFLNVPEFFLLSSVLNGFNLLSLGALVPAWVVLGVRRLFSSEAFAWPSFGEFFCSASFWNSSNALNGVTMESTLTSFCAAPNLAVFDVLYVKLGPCFFSLEFPLKDTIASRLTSVIGD